jgi:hypothetical protein
MHENALLRAKVHDLEQASKMVSWRRSAKRSRLQQGVMMTVGERRQAIDQMDVNAQVEGESSRSGDQEGSARQRCAQFKFK